MDIDSDMAVFLQIGGSFIRIILRSGNRMVYGMWYRIYGIAYGTGNMVYGCFCKFGVLSKGLWAPFQGVWG